MTNSQLLTNEKGIGIVTISYNQAAYLSACLASIGPQLGDGDMHIIVDPGSTDQSRELIVKYVAADPSRRKFIFERDDGPVDGLRKAVDMLSTAYFCYINSDDGLLEGALNYVRRHFRLNPSTDMLMGAIKICDGSGHFYRRGRVCSRPGLLSLASQSVTYVQQANFIKLSVYREVGGFFVGNGTCWDYELMVDVFISGKKIDVITKPLAFFRIHSSSITGTGRLSEKYAIDSRRIALKIMSNMERGAPSLLLILVCRIWGRLNIWRQLAAYRSIS